MVDRRRFTPTSFVQCSIFALAGLAAGTGCSPSAPPPPAAAKVTFVTVQPQARTVTNDYPARIEASNTVEIRPRVGGLLLRQAAIEGKSVKRGETLFIVDPAPYEAALAEAKGELAKANAAFAV